MHFWCFSKLILIAIRIEIKIRSNFISWCIVVVWLANQRSPIWIPAKVFSFFFFYFYSWASKQPTIFKYFGGKIITQNHSLLPISKASRNMASQSTDFAISRFLIELKSTVFRTFEILLLRILINSVTLKLQYNVLDLLCWRKMTHFQASKIHATTNGMQILHETREDCVSEEYLDTFYTVKYVRNFHLSLQISNFTQ